MGFQKGLARVGLAKQTVKGTAVTPPEYAFGVSAGAIVDVEIAQDLEALTLADNLVAPRLVRGNTVPVAPFTTRAFPASLGLLLLGALGTDVVGGAGPYTHTITPATDVDYLTVTGDLGGVIREIRDAKVGELTISWSENNPLTVVAALTGTVLSFPASFGAPGTDDSLAAIFTPCGGTFLIDVEGATPAAAPIKAGTIRITNNLAAIVLSGASTPNDVAVGAKVLEANLTIVPDNLDAWREIATGSAAGAGLTCTPVYGSYDVLFVEGADSLQIASGRVGFMTSFPEADPAGGPVELELAGKIVVPAAGGDAITATLINGVSAY